MTQQSYPGDSNDAASSSGSSVDGNSTATLSSDVYPLPFSIGQKEIVLSNGERGILTELPDNNAVLPGANVCIQGSSNIDFGNRTIFESDVTIIQYIKPEELQNGHAVNDEVQCNKNDRVKNQHHQTLLQKRRYLLVPFTLLLLLLLTTISIYIYKDSIFSNTPRFPPVNPDTNYSIQGYPVYSKLNWGALPRKEAPPLLPLPSSVVIVSHTATQGCSTFTQCANQTQYVQYDFLKKGHRDIGYNFLIGGDGGIYEGRGWERQNSLRAKSISISFIGDFNKELLSDTVQNATKALLEEGVGMGMLDESYKLIGENQTSPLRFYSPGWNAVKEIKKWEHYFPGTML